MRRIALLLTLIIFMILLIPLFSLYWVIQGNPEPLRENFVPRDNDADDFEYAYDQISEEIEEDASFSIYFTSDQFASWLNRRYNEASDEEVEQVDLPGPLSSFTFDELQNIQVAFEGDSMYLYAETGIGTGASLAMRLEAIPGINEDGQLNVEIIEAQLGRIHMSENIRDQLSNPLEDALTRLLKDEVRSYELDSVEIQSDGLLIKGHAVESD